LYLDQLIPGGVSRSLLAVRMAGRQSPDSLQATGPDGVGGRAAGTQGGTAALQAEGRQVAGGDQDRAKWRTNGAGRKASVPLLGGWACAEHSAAGPVAVRSWAGFKYT